MPTVSAYVQLKAITAEAGHIYKYTLKYVAGSSCNGGKMNQN